MRLSIIIVSYNTSLILRNCLLLVYKALSFGKLVDNSEVIVVDNSSRDDSVEMVKKNFPKVKLITNGKNLGFAKANNQGIKEAKGKFVLLLNSDTEVSKDTFTLLLGKLERNQKIGVLGPKLINKDGTLQQSVGFFPTLPKVFFWMSFLDDLPYFSSLLKPYHMQNPSFYKREQKVDWVSGACIFTRKGAVGANLMDEKIFMYGEEVEWCYRIKKSGYEIEYSPQTSVYHLKGASSDGEYAGIVDEIRSLIFFYRKHKPFWQSVVLRFFLMWGALLRMIIFGIIGRNPKRFFLYAQVFVMAGR